MHLSLPVKIGAFAEGYNKTKRLFRPPLAESTVETDAQFHCFVILEELSIVTRGSSKRKNTKKRLVDSLGFGRRLLYFRNTVSSCHVQLKAPKKHGLHSTKLAHA